MPFRTFDAATAALLGAAFDDAWADLEKSGHFHGRDIAIIRERLATIIINLADKGPIDPQALATVAAAKFML
jgi:hypothetical protein